MASDSAHKHEFRIRDLGTRSVLLFPTRAQIIRDIKDIALKPGSNKIIIDGLAPTVDEHSIKVEGTGSATISDVTVDLLPNRDVYEEIYPSDSEEEDDDSSDSEPEHESMTTMHKKIKALSNDLLAEKEKINNAANQLNICDNFGRSISVEHMGPDKLAEVLKVYNEQRKQIFSDHEVYTAAAENIQEEITKAEKEKTKLAKELVKVQLKEQKAKKKLKDRAIRRKAELLKEKQRVKAERESFWAKKVYRITISLEASTVLTPGSSRRSSITEGEVTDLAKNLATTTFHQPDEALKDGSISLSLSYITYSAYWSPRYDLNLDSIRCTGVLEYSADLKNETSETWRDAKVILSTSQTTFSGLSEEIPVLHPWHVRLVKGGRNANSGLMSQAELDSKRKEWNATQSQKPRQWLFGVDNSEQKKFAQEHMRRKNAMVTERGQQLNALVQRSSNTAANTVPFGNSVSFGNAGNVGTFANVANVANAMYVPPPQPMMGSSLFGGPSSQSMIQPRQSSAIAGYQRDRMVASEKVDADDDDGDEDMGFGLFDDEGPRQDPNSLVFEEGAWEESGMTTTYDVPGVKTLGPSKSNIKHKIARVDFKNVVFSHIIIGKLRQVAFLKARLRNASKITLLKGPLGLSLDGSFLGSATFPRCSAGETFSLPLGVDPAIQIVYTKPTVRRSQSGIFNKEDSNVFTRSITITNTKNNAPIELTVLDQIPVSEDERLRIDILAPRGLKLGSDPVRTGTSASASSGSATLSKGSAQASRASSYGGETGKEVEKQIKWGAAEATTKKGGEVSWNVRLNPGCSVKLGLEYEAVFPGGETIVGANGV